MLCFLDLPLPIREEIYRYALVTERVFVRPFISMQYLTDQNRGNHSTPALSLLRVSRQAYKEALPMYLGENTFSIVQVDLLAAAARKCSRVLDNLKQIRKIEVIFDSRDYNYMAQFLAEELPAVTRVVEQLSCDHDPEHKSSTVDKLKALHAHFEMSGVSGCLFDSAAARSASNRTHRQHIENMKEYFWGRTLAFLRQAFRLSHLYVGLSRCMCARGCCRLAEEVLGWGGLHTWVYGLPREIRLRGTSRRERIAIRRILDSQKRHSVLSRTDPRDAGRGVDTKEVDRYDEVLREVQWKIDSGRMF